MRYWLDGEDEDYERELEGVSRFGGVPPQPISPLHVVGVTLLVGIHAIALTFLVVAFALRVQ